VPEIRILTGDCRQVLRTLPAVSVHCCVTSPPYFGLRDYGHGGQIGLEQTPNEYVDELVFVFREVRRVLRDDGTLWLNLGDSYASGNRATYRSGASDNKGQTVQNDQPRPRDPPGIKPKDLLGIPWRVAFALQADGWYLRQDIIWSKPNPMPESVRDRCTKAHEYVFLLSKSERYFYDAAAISEPVTPSTISRLAQDVEAQAGSDRVPGKTNGAMKAKGPRFGGNNTRPESQTKSGNVYTVAEGDTRNKRSVWTITTQPFAEAHFATMAPELADTCIKAGCPAEYVEIARRRIAGDAPLFADVAVASA
jgi:hypothetical protein